MDYEQWTDPMTGQVEEADAYDRYSLAEESLPSLSGATPGGSAYDEALDDWR